MLPITALGLLGFALAYPFVNPAPPARIVMATGEAGGAYARFCEAPACCGEELYQLLLHVEFVQGQLAERRSRQLAGIPEEPNEVPESVGAGND